MAYCKSCSAPLLANTNRCQYCGVRNDVDLSTKYKFSVYKKASDRICPHCEKPLQTIQIQLDQSLLIERCDTCFGLFFDLQELEILLDYSVSHVTAINQAHLDSINADHYPKKQVVKYIKCPVCRKFMRRANFAQKSGVIVDSCRSHGLWLDSGEVKHLMEWKRLGGQLLHQQTQRDKALKGRKAQTNSADRIWELPKDKQAIDLEADLLEFLAYIVNRIM
ncbi:MAG: hypothetical protein DRQ62_04570 [Gammaproteobacteria bacterium]|nr:MAG: hypothetical protein DRQ62_04570 [Gammaproteobacteria bacterium]